MAAKPKTTASLNKRNPVVVTTEHRGVFFGYLREDKSPDRVILDDARMCIFWSAKVHGVLGLAATGPDKDSRVGPKTPQATLLKITAIIQCTDEAADKWEAEPWN